VWFRHCRGYRLRLAGVVSDDWDHRVRALARELGLTVGYYNHNREVLDMLHEVALRLVVAAIWVGTEKGHSREERTKKASGQAACCRTKLAVGVAWLCSGHLCGSRPRGIHEPGKNKRCFVRSW
jgi:hypothetical protein